MEAPKALKALKAKKVKKVTKTLVTSEAIKARLALKAGKGRKAKKIKKCVKCGEKKPTELFPKHSGSSDGFAAYCNSCKNDKHKERRKKNLSFRLKHHIATRVLKQISRDNQPQNFTTNLEIYLGYRIFQLKKALSADLRMREHITLREAFEKGYHLDHIKPLSHFHPQIPSDQAFKDCWAIKNLRMISAEENLAKGANYPQ